MSCTRGYVDQGISLVPAVGAKCYAPGCVSNGNVTDCIKYEASLTQGPDRETHIHTSRVYALQASTETIAISSRVCASPHLTGIDTTHAALVDENVSFVEALFHEAHRTLLPFSFHILISLIISMLLRRLLCISVCSTTALDGRVAGVVAELLA